jgi:hypothetical protein
MRSYHVSRISGNKSPIAWQYRQSTFDTWKIFPNQAASNVEAMERFLSDNGKWDKPSLVFTDPEGRVASTVEVSRLKGKQLSVRINAGQQAHVLHEWDIIPQAEQLEFYKSRATDDFNQSMVNKSLPDALELYKQNADQTVSDEFFDLYTARSADEGIASLLKFREGENTVIVFPEIQEWQK